MVGVVVGDHGDGDGDHDSSSGSPAPLPLDGGELGGTDECGRCRGRKGG